SREDPDLAVTQILPSLPAAANFLSGTSMNPLDDLVCIFEGMSTVEAGAGSEGSVGDGGGLGGFTGLVTASLPLASVSPLDSHMSPSTVHRPQEDLGLF
ncbi:hypothetical protein V8B97DRAFT_2032574, partial [Scleroderma yunnanense]